MCLRPRPPPVVVPFVACSLPLVVDFIIAAYKPARETERH